MSFRRLCCALLACGLISLGFSASNAAAATPPAGFFGLSSWSYPTDAQASDLGQSGLKLFRGALGWSDVEAQQGTRDWTYQDALMERAANGGFDVLLAVDSCPAWACGTTGGAPTSAAARADFASFITAAVSRYGANGSFWAAHPELQRPKVMWQIWNEINGGAFWPNPTAADYATFLAAANTAIKAVDPAATVVTSGLVEHPANSDGVPLDQFLTQLYQQPEYASSFDAGAVHGYSNDPQGTYEILDTARRIMLSNGDSAKPLWVTEMGWASGGPAHPFTVDPDTQAAYLRSSWSTMLACRSRWNLQRVLWFGLTDADAATMGEPDYWGYHTGVLNNDGSPKPSDAAFLSYIGSAPLPDGAGDTCPLQNGNTLDTTDPTTTITSSPRTSNNLSSASVDFTASETGGNFQCSLDSSNWTPCSSPYPVPSTREGEHNIRVRAIDAQGNIDATPATAQWMLDLSAPDTTLLSRTSATTTSRTLQVAFTGKDAVGVAGFQCSVDAKAPKPCKSPFVVKDLALGKHTIHVQAIDTSGNIDKSALSPTFKINLPVCAGTTPVSTHAHAARKTKAKAKKKVKVAACLKTVRVSLHGRSVRRTYVVAAH